MRGRKRKSETRTDDRDGGDQVIESLGEGGKGEKDIKERNNRKIKCLVSSFAEICFPGEAS